MLQRTRHNKAVPAADLANTMRKTHPAMTGNYDDYNLWGVPKSSSTAEKELSRAYDARLFAIRKRNEARRRQWRDQNQALIKAA
jgi:hypothetical protein